MAGLHKERAERHNTWAAAVHLTVLVTQCAHVHCPRTLQALKSLPRHRGLFPCGSFSQSIDASGSRPVAARESIVPTKCAVVGEAATPLERTPAEESTLSTKANLTIQKTVKSQSLAGLGTEEAHQHTVPWAAHWGGMTGGRVSRA